MENLRHAQVSETGESLYAVSIQVSQHSLTGDEPADAGGGNLGPAPYDLLLAALGECTAMTVRWYAKEQNYPLEKVEVALTHCKESTGSGRIDHFTKRVTLQGAELTEEQRAKLIEVADKCPIQRTMDGSAKFKTSAA